MRIVRKLGRWSAVAVVLAALGMGIFHFNRSRPRFVVSGNQEILHLSADGRWLVTSEIEPAILAVYRGVCSVPGCLHVYDTCAGRRVRSFEVQRTIAIPQPGCCIGALFGPLPMCQSRHWVAWMEQPDVYLLNWQSGEQFHIRLDEPMLSSRCEFSPAGRWLVLSEKSENWAMTIVIDVHAGRVVRQFNSPLLAFLREDRFALVHADQHRLDLINMETGAVIGSLQTECELIGDVVLSPDGNWLVFGHGRDVAERPRGVEVWDLPNRRRAIRFDEENARLIDLAFAHRDGQFATWSRADDKCCIALFDPRQQQPLRKFDLPERADDDDRVVVYNVLFSPDHTTMLANTSGGTDGFTLMFDIHSGRPLWRKLDRRGISFSADGKSILCNKWPEERLHWLDAATGAVKVELAPDLRDHRLISSTPENRLAVIHGGPEPLQPLPEWRKFFEKYRPRWLKAPTEWFVVTESETGRELLRVSAPGCSATLSDDGSTLVTWPMPGGFLDAPDAPRRLEVWDISSDRALFGATAWPLSVGVILLLFRLCLKRKAIA